MTSELDISSPAPPAAHLRNAFRLRCPNCGSQKLFRRWVVMAEACPRCHLKLDRGEVDYFLGSYVVNFVVAELLIVAGAAVTILVTLTEVPWAALKRWLPVLATVTPAVFYPFAKTVWLAIDLRIRPVHPDDFRIEGANADPDPRS